ncbi:MAG: hypothetical protein OEY07_00665 [Gammaproteobacteria bacterium]|nr:hypothetical protein [Gammaproteobacteria bacterium]
MRRLILLTTPFIVYYVTKHAHLSYVALSEYPVKNVGESMYFILPAVMCMLLPVGILLQTGRPDALLPRVFIFSGGALFMFWTVSALLVRGQLLDYQTVNPDMLARISIIVGTLAAWSGVISAGKSSTT